MVKATTTHSVNRKLLAVLLSFAIVVSLLSGLGITASAAYRPTGTMTQLWNGGTPGPVAAGDVYSLSSEAELNYFQQYVNGRYPTGNVTFFLTRDISLTGPWTPIGTEATPFNGIFDGSDQDPTTIRTISRMSITDISGLAAYYGLFGYSNGPIMNVNVNGRISLMNKQEYVGGIVGYTTSDVYNCHTRVDINAPTSSQVGGVVGAIENTATEEIASPFHVQASSASGNITGFSRVGGVVGSVYCGFYGNVVVDNCYFASGTPILAQLSTADTADRSYGGGVVGYCQGYISNSYAVAALSRSGGRYIAGIVSLLQGNGPQARLSNSYAAVSFGGQSDPDYDRPLYDSNDYSNGVQINNCLYDSTLAGEYENIVGTDDNQWGIWTKTGSGDEEAMKGDGDVTVYSPGDDPDSENLPALTVLGGAFAADTSTPENDGYPILAWQSSPSLLPVYIPGDGSYTPPTETGIFIDGVNGDDENDGTSAIDAVKTLLRALNLATRTVPAQTIFVIDTVTLNNGSNPQLNLAGTQYEGITIRRSRLFNGTLFQKPIGITATVSGVTIDGNKSKVSAAFSLITSRGYSLTDDILTIGSGAVLIDNICSEGGAVDVLSGMVNMTAGTLSGHETRRGGAVYVADGAAFDMSGGTISENTAQNVGGGVATRGPFNFSGGSISDNTITSPNGNGGGVAVMGNGAFTFSGGTLSGNTAADGSAVYVDSTDGSLATFSITSSNLRLYGTIYLSPGTSVTTTVSLTSLLNPLNIVTDSSDLWSSRPFVVGSGVTLDSDDLAQVTWSTTPAPPSTWQMILLNNNSIGIISTDRADNIYLDGTVTVSTEDGSYANPYMTAAAALSAANGRTIYVSGQTPLSGTTTISDATFVRDFTGRGNLFSIPSGSAITLTGVTADGASASRVPSTGSLFYVDGGTLTVGSGTALQNNLAETGGGVYVNSGALSLPTGGLISNNTATTSGGGVYVNGGTATLNGGTVSGNRALGTTGSFLNRGTGGGIFQATSTSQLALISGSITGNSAVSGGGVGVSGGGLSIAGADITYNTANTGGGVYLSSGATVPFSSGTVSYNTANTGGGIYISSGTVSMGGGLISYNEATDTNGGGVFNNSSGGGFTLNGGIISNNKAPSGNGGGIQLNGGTLLIQSGSISSNQAGTNGGGVDISYGYVTMSGGSISNNEAGLNGGGVWIPSDIEIIFTLTGGEISGNKVNGAGSGVYVTRSGTFEISPSGAGAVSFGTGATANNVYLPSGVTFNIGAELDDGVNGVIPLTIQSATVGRLVAVADSDDIADNSLGALSSGSIEFEAQGANIVIVALRTA
jgi:hypothetical protein